MHLDWIKNFKNDLFSNDASFYGEYLSYFIKKKMKMFRKMKVTMIVMRVKMRLTIKKLLEKLKKLVMVEKILE